MGIRFNPELNRRLIKSVTNYNRRVTRANKLGGIRKDELPEKVRIRDLKRNYTNRKELINELENLESFRRKDVRKDALEAVSKYDLALIKNNRNETLKFLKNREKILQKRVKNGYPFEKTDLETVRHNIDVMNLNPETASQDELEAMERQVNNYRVFKRKQGAGYRGFMSEVDFVMRNVGIGAKERKEFFDKFSKLTPEELYYIYETNGLIDAIYGLADSPSVGNTKLNTTQVQAEQLIDELIKQADSLIKEAKAQS